MLNVDDGANDLDKVKEDNQMKNKYWQIKEEGPVASK